MLKSNSLRFRVAVAFAAFGALLSILSSLAVYFAAHELGDRLIDETLTTEMEESVERHARDSIFVPPNTVSIKGYVLSDAGENKNIPLKIISLPVGTYDRVIEGVDYRVLVADRNGVRYFELFDIDARNERYEVFIRILFFLSLFVTAASAGVGYWLATQIISPVTRLAQQVGKAEPGDENLSLSEMLRNDEVGELARAFDHYVHRINKFIERENYFTADVGHELRTPLAIILGALEVLEQDETFSVKQKERMARIKHAAQDMTGLTAALLLLAYEYQPSTGKQSYDVSEVLSATVKNHRHLIGGRPIRVELEFQGKPHLVVERPLLEIVIGNLLRNALLNTQSGLIVLRLEQSQLIVKDSGVGMSEEVSERALKFYYKGASSTGAGVGLSLVKRICERYGWHISIDSKEGYGTSIKIDFMRQEAN